MNNIKNSVFYVTVIGGFTALIYWVISKGASLEVGRNIVKKSVESNHWKDFLHSMIENLQASFSHFIGTDRDDHFSGAFVWMVF